MTHMAFLVTFKSGFIIHRNFSFHIQHVSILTVIDFYKKAKENVCFFV